jgi:hypothetical protein
MGEMQVQLQRLHDLTSRPCWGADGTPFPEHLPMDKIVERCAINLESQYENAGENLVRRLDDMATTISTGLMKMVHAMPGTSSTDNNTRAFYVFFGAFCFAELPTQEEADQWIEELLDTIKQFAMAQVHESFSAALDNRPANYIDPMTMTIGGIYEDSETTG